MPHQITRDTFWVASDGSYGHGRILTVDTSGWSKEKTQWLDDLTMADLFIEDVQSIDNNIKPDCLED